MDQWYGKLSVVTGASSGIGESITTALLKNGVNVVGLARRLENMRELKERMKDAKGTFYPVQCDLSREQDILNAFKIVEKLGGPDILVNNAALLYSGPISDAATNEMKMILDVNVLAVAMCSREAIKSLKERGAQGHIVNINRCCFLR
ncbi:farnesol dehydrogenase-like [Ceratina calcarata]|uniref:Farnesol dehydrogenase-like n=1 Tax=Ceratina calcarata TaxID=156304 RepID=A0AAJ7N4C6_9HYME|nr:farnesol dehydrogenase-like [Ceratina calcarata]